MTSEMQESDYVDKNYCHRSLSPQDHLERERGQGVRGRELGREGGRERGRSSFTIQSISSKHIAMQAQITHQSALVDLLLTASVIRRRCSIVSAPDPFRACAINTRSGGWGKTKERRPQNGDVICFSLETEYQ